MSLYKLIVLLFCLGGAIAQIRIGLSDLTQGHCIIFGWFTICIGIMALFL